VKKLTSVLGPESSEHPDQIWVLQAPAAVEVRLKLDLWKYQVGTRAIQNLISEPKMNDSLRDL
jgi:hypothetical protein